MKKTILLTSIIAIAIVSMLSSCVDSEKDLYDPSYQTANPMGDGFAAKIVVYFGLKMYLLIFLV